MRHIHIYVLVALSFLWTCTPMGVQDWNFLLHKFEYNSSNPDLLTINMRTSRKEPGVYALNGTADLGVDIDDKFSIEVVIFRSSTRSGQYKITPYQIQRKKYCDFIQNVYVPMLQNDFKSCSNLPVTDGKCDKTIEKGTYTFDMCLVTNAGMPAHIQPGFYKIIAHINSDDLDVWICVFAEAEPKNMM